MILPAKSIQTKAVVATVISDKIDFKIKTLTRDKDEHFIMIKGTTHQKDIILLNVYAPNQGAPKYIKQLLLKGKNDYSRGPKYPIYSRYRYRCKSIVYRFTLGTENQ